MSEHSQFSNRLASDEDSNASKHQKYLRFASDHETGDSSPDSFQDDHDEDCDYEPSPEEALAFPHASQIPDLSERQKEKVLLKDPNGGACLVTGLQVPGVTEYAHVVRSTTHISLLESFEKLWKLEKAFHIHTSNNILLLGPDIHQYFDKDMWCLIPTIEHLDKIRRNKDAMINIYDVFADETVFEYRILAFSELRHVRFDRQTPIGMDEPKEYKEHKFPFNELTLSTHVPPHFVVVNSGEKIVQRIQLMKALDSHGDGKALQLIPFLAKRAGVSPKVLEAIARTYISWLGGDPWVESILDKVAENSTLGETCVLEDPSFDAGGSHLRLKAQVTFASQAEQMKRVEDSLRPKEVGNPSAHENNSTNTSDNHWLRSHKSSHPE